VAEPEHDASWVASRRHVSAVGRRRRYVFLVARLGIGIAVGLLAALVIDVQSRGAQPPEPRPLLLAPYHAVRLSTGRMVVGRVDRLNSPFIVVSEAYTVQPAPTGPVAGDPVAGGPVAGAKEPACTIAPRGEEAAAAPATVIVGAQQVVSIEAVLPGSRLAAMLDEVRAKK